MAACADKFEFHDEYIAAAPEFAQPILEKLRKVVHKACPDVEETIKWSSPHFEHQGILAGMAAFKKHVSFAFWRGKELSDPDGLFEGVGRTNMCALKIEKVADLPPEGVLVRYLKEAIKLNEAAAKAPNGKEKPAGRKASAKRTVKAPPDLMAALRKKKRALATFEGFSYSNRKEYVEWVTEAKREATRAKRIEQAVAWMAEGKPRNWKYMKNWQ